MIFPSKGAKVKSIKNINNEGPSEVVIEVTSKCNFNCDGCFNKESFAELGRDQYLSNTYIKEIINSAVEAKVEMIRFTGGEPLLRPDIFDLISYAKNKGVATRLNTNASCINEDNIKLIDKYVDSVLVSFNGFDSISDEAWTNLPRSYDKKIKGLALLSSSSSVKIRIGTVLTKSNILNLEKIFEIIQQFKICWWEVYRPIAKDSFETIGEDIELVVNKLVKLSVRFGSIIPIANAIPFCIFDKELMNLVCLGAKPDDGHSRIIVDPRGFAKPSYFINENIGDPRDILSCWNHPFMKEMRSLKMIPSECTSCEYLESCKGGSRFKAKAVFGSYGAQDPLMIKKL